MSDRTEELKQFLDNMIDGNAEQAEVHLHSYVADKMRSIVKPPVEPDQEANTDDE
jgi:hypothetical protein